MVSKNRTKRRVARKIFFYFCIDFFKNRTIYRIQANFLAKYRSQYSSIGLNFITNRDNLVIYYLHSSLFLFIFAAYTALF